MRSLLWSDLFCFLSIMEEQQDKFEFEEGDALDELEAGTGRRSPQMLKALCILTWTYTFLSLLLFTVFLGNKKNVVELLSFEKEGNNTFLLFYLIFPLVCSVGAFFMFRLNRWGFLIYLAGQIPPIAYAFYQAFFVLHIEGPAMVFVILPQVVPLGFVILYFTQLHVMEPWTKKVREIS